MEHQGSTELIDSLIDIHRFIANCEDYASLGWNQIINSVLLPDLSLEINTAATREYLRNINLEEFKRWMSALEELNDDSLSESPLWDTWRHKYLRCRLSWLTMEREMLIEQMTELEEKLNLEPDAEVPTSLNLDF